MTHRTTEWFWIFMCYEIALLCFNETRAGHTALDITLNMTRKYNTSAGCESKDLESKDFLTYGNSTILPELTRCKNTESNRCFICLRSQWFVNSCSKLYSVPNLICPDLPKRIILNQGSFTANIVWNEPKVDAISRLTTYDNGIESGQNVTSGFYSLLYSATNNQGLTFVCTTEFLVSEIKCVLPPIPDGGARTYNGSSLGSSCHYRCFTGFYMDQQYNVITCKSDGEYNRRSPKCLNLSPPKITCFPPSNFIPVDPVSLTGVTTWKFPVAVDQSGGIIEPLNIHQMSSIYSSGDVAPRGLHYFQYNVIDINGASDSCSFTIDMRLIQCRVLNPPVNGNITCNSTNFIQNTQCVYSCIPGYILNGFSVLTCLGTEIYDYPEPSCKVLKCPEPSEISSGSYISCSNNNNINSICVILCEPGFNLTSSDNTALCLPSGNWNTSFQLCKDSEPPVFLNCPKTNTFRHYDSRFENSVPVIWSVIIVTDNSGEAITPEVKEGRDSGELYHPGVTRIQYHAVDSKSNQAFCQFHIIISVLASGCSAGNRFDANSDNCVRCDVGFYQDIENALECKQCPGGFTTESLGASTIRDCKRNEKLLSRDRRASTPTSCSEPVFNDPYILFKCTGYDMNDACQLSCLSGRQPIGSNKIICVFDMKKGIFIWLTGSGDQPRCRPHGDLFGMLCTICKKFISGANCCPIHELGHTDWMPLDFVEIKPQPPCEDFVQTTTGQGYASVISGVKSFKLNCPVDMSLPRNTRNATCDLKTGVWNPAPWLQECTKRYSPIEYRLAVTASYSGRSCSSTGDREQLRLRFTSLLESAKVWQYHCPSSRQCSAVNVMAFCSYYRRKKRDIRKRASTMYKTDITWYFSIKLLVDEMKSEKIRQLKNVLFNMFFGFATDTYSGKFNQIFGYYFDYASLNMGEFTFACDEGGVYDIATKACLVCSSGSMFDVTRDKCIECKQGYYQDRENSRTCFQCPPRTTTRYTGSKYHTQCQIQCSAGYFSANGFLPCLPCPDRGTSTRGSTKCQHKRPLPQIRDFCANSTCVANNHTCQNVVDGYRCFCKLGYRGQECNITINPCTYLQCENRGVCKVSPEEKAICRCPDGYTGDYCQIKKDYDRISTWTEWLAWGDCKTHIDGCGQGIQTRARNCITDVKGTQCTGTDTDSRECNKIGCPVCKEEHLRLPHSVKINCSWSNSSVSNLSVLVCNVGCREGYKSLYNVSHVTCKEGIWTSGLAKNICIVEPEWSDWSAWSSCPSVCDGERQRTRKCSNPPFYLGPLLCKGDILQSYPCRRDYPDRKCSNCSVTDLLIPSTMKVSCSVIKGILTCIMSCQSNQLPFYEITLNHAYTCNQGIWSPSYKVFPCTDFHQPLAISKLITATYQTNCTDKSKAANVTTEISSNFIRIISSASHQVSIQTSQCTTEYLVVTVRIKTNIEETVNFIGGFESVSVLKSYQGVFAVNSSEDVILPANIAAFSQLHCPDNTVAQGAYCVECPAGSYYHLDECLLCPRGSYQPNAGQCSCIRCPFRTITRYRGSWSVIDCK